MNMERENRNLELVNLKDYDTLVRENEKLITAIMKRFYFNIDDYDDIFNIGRITIYNAALKYNKDNGNSFTVYLYSAIYRNILNYISRKAKPKVETVSLDKIVSDDDDLEFVDLVAVDNDKNNNPEVNIIFMDVMKIINDSLLSEKDRQVLYFKITKGLSFRDISEIMGVTHQVLAKRYKRVICRIRYNLVRAGYDYDYLINLL